MTDSKTSQIHLGLSIKIVADDLIISDKDGNEQIRQVWFPLLKFQVECTYSAKVVKNKISNHFKLISLIQLTAFKLNLNLFLFIFLMFLY